MTDSPLPTFPPVTGQDILNCSFSSWYTKYHRFSPRARIIKPLPEAFIAFLKADGIVIPGGNNTSLISEIEELESDAEEQTELKLEHDPLADFTALLTREIAVLNGAVVPKLNWSTAKDALWITTTNSLKCESPEDIYLLLKSSDFISHDLYHPYDNCIEPFPKIEYELVLKEWYDLVLSMEFRGFVRNRKFLCICQRDKQYYTFLKSLQPEILRLATELFERIKDFESENWVFDMYIPRTRRRAHLIDMNPFAPRTDPILFHWHEILEMTGDQTIMRLVKEEDRGIGGMEFSAQRMPVEIIQASQGKGVVEFAAEWEEMLREGVTHDEISSEEE